MTALGAGVRGAPELDILQPAAATRASIRRGTAARLVPHAEPALARRKLWERRYAWRLRITDTAIVLTVTVVTAFIAGRFVTTTGFRSTLQVAVMTAAAWLVMLWLGRTRSASIMGSGATEYKRVAHTTGFAFGLIAMIFVVFQLPGIRLQLAAALPAGMLALLASRWAWRKWLLRQRCFGHYTSRVLVTGSRDDIEYVLRNLERGGSLGYSVVGVAPSDQRSEPIIGEDHAYQVVGTMNAAATLAHTLEADAIIVASRPEDDPEFIKRLSWELEGTAAELIISSRLADVAGPRISLHPVDGLPLIHVAIPEFEGGKHSLKRAMDVTVSALALIGIALITPFLALAIKLDSPGPVFFKQTRICRDGREFSILKFRTMYVDAEARLAELRSQNEGSGLLFKMKNDPRITRVGAILRRYSLDELPQFWNVLRGEMSVVGPRPPLPSEVCEYHGKVYRRLFTKPGITGLWQISGRSDLSWEESVRLDLSYVENWSMTGDLIIMWRTAKVMIAPKGAY